MFPKEKLSFRGWWAALMDNWGKERLDMSPGLKEGVELVRSDEVLVFLSVCLKMRRTPATREAVYCRHVFAYS